MNTILIVSLIVAAAAGSIVTMAILFPLLRRKGVNTQQVIDTTQSALQTADAITDSLKGAMPENKAIQIIDKTISVAEKGVAMAEQLCKSSQLDKDQRRETAIDFVKNALTLSGVEITPDIEKIIDGAVEAAVYALPKTGAVTASAA